MTKWTVTLYNHHAIGRSQAALGRTRQEAFYEAFRAAPRVFLLAGLNTNTQDLERAVTWLGLFNDARAAMVRGQTSATRSHNGLTVEIRRNLA
jgi:hypothetical protein